MPRECPPVPRWLLPQAACLWDWRGAPAPPARCPRARPARPPPGCRPAGPGWAFHTRPALGRGSAAAPGHTCAGPPGRAAGSVPEGPAAGTFPRLLPAPELAFGWVCLVLVFPSLAHFICLAGALCSAGAERVFCREQVRKQTRGRGRHGEARTHAGSRSAHLK